MIREHEAQFDAGNGVIGDVMGHMEVNGLLAAFTSWFPRASHFGGVSAPTTHSRTMHHGVYELRYTYPPVLLVVCSTLSRPLDLISN